MKSDKENPWSLVSDLEELHFYCCPECQVRDLSKKIFVQHALEQHPNSKIFFLENLFNACIDDDNDEEIQPEDDLEHDEVSINNEDNFEIKEETTCNPLNLNNEKLEKIDPERCEIQKVTNLSFMKEFNEDHNQESDVDFDESTEDQIDFDQSQVDNQEFYNDNDLEDDIENDISDDTTKQDSIPNTLSELKKCNLCPKKFQTQKLLNNHICSTYYRHPNNRVHVKSKVTYNCDSCKYSTFSKKVLHKHSLKHQKIQPDKTSKVVKIKLTKQNTIIVDIAKQVEKGESANYNSDLPKKPKMKDKNIDTHDEKDVKCEVCGKVLSSSVNLKHHIKAVHEGQRPHQCYICGKSYKWPDNLKYHMDYTHFSKTLQCPQCEKSFASIQGVLRHKKVVHEGIPQEKNFICDKCSRSYNQNNKLMRHIQTFHDKIYEFKCKICNKEYGKKDQLKYHMESVHQKIRITCDICGKVTDRRSMKAHMKYVHEKKEKWKCDICFKILYKPSHLKTHFMTIHGKEITHQSAKQYLIE